MNPPGDFPLSEEERMGRIGAFMCRLARSQPIEPAKALPPPSDPPSDEGAAPRDQVIAYLQRHGEVSPLELRLSLGLSRTTAYRLFQRLLDSGTIAIRGNTRSVTYTAIPADPFRN
jgi:CRP-like cAMP-binding protein